ncbi:hypothetical protein OC846_000982 [Tilletia horrida]|uniref:tRNA-5-taurinomethyluridine 2-sulfurtransferase n=1 Tax=Tilletia horrida TaxID=155126 RepID=A0AAN6GWT6_9BASI|nr:hypothetical protein OC846_000982 [Tilletia horrida]
MNARQRATGSQRLRLGQDFDLEAVFMRNWTADEPAASVLDTSDQTPSLPYDQSSCTWRQDYESAQAVCRHLSNLPLRLLDFQKEYWNSVFEPALSVWEAGETPNPDVACNRHIKFGVLMADLLGEPGPSKRRAWLATGHYSRLRLSPTVQPDGSRSVELLRAIDPNKDQSYYLSSVEPSRFRQAHFPIGHLLKGEVRELARRYELPNAERKESMGLCFVGDNLPRARSESVGTRGKPGEPGPFATFLDSYIESTPGPLISPTGEVLGQHSGLHTLTIGQSARIPGQTERWYVARKSRGQRRQGGSSTSDDSMRANEVVVVPGRSHPLLLCVRARVKAFSWVAGQQPAELNTANSDGDAANVRAWAQVRHRQKAVPCRVTIRAKEGQDVPPRLLDVEFDDPVAAVAPGQVLALWADGDATTGDAGARIRPNVVCLGSGVIEDVVTVADLEKGPQ